MIMRLESILHVATGKAMGGLNIVYACGAWIPFEEGDLHGGTAVGCLIFSYIICDCLSENQPI